MLNGSYTGKVDEKGRIKVPSEFRRRIKDRYDDTGFYVTSTGDNCARIYPARAWLEVLDILDKAPSSMKSAQKFRRLTSYYGQSASMDQQGRILIHPRLRQKAAIDDEVLILGQNKHMEVWNHKKFQEDLEQNLLTDQDNEELARLGI